MDDSKLYLYDAVDASPKFFVKGSTVYRLNGEAAFTIDGEKQRMTPMGSTKPAFRIVAEGWVTACGRAVLMSPAMDRVLAGVWQTRDVHSLIA
jgi:hypothetical protein